MMMFGHRIFVGMTPELLHTYVIIIHTIVCMYVSHAKTDRLYWPITYALYYGTKGIPARAGPRVEIERLVI